MVPFSAAMNYFYYIAILSACSSDRNSRGVSVTFPHTSFWLEWEEWVKRWKEKCNENMGGKCKTMAAIRGETWVALKRMEYWN